VPPTADAIGSAQLAEYRRERTGLAIGRGQCFAGRVVSDSGTPVNDFEVAGNFLRRFHSTSPRRRSRIAAQAPIGAIQTAALDHPNPWMRRGCLGFLDHYANEQSLKVFVAALRDPVEPVRHIALHSIACETCRSEELCLAEVIPELVETLRFDPSPEVRHKTVPMLMRLASRDCRAGEAVALAAVQDDDVLVRQVAGWALHGGHVRSRKAVEREPKHRPSPAGP
jgi:HEAT repeat protein